MTRWTMMGASTAALLLAACGGGNAPTEDAKSTPLGANAKPMSVRLLSSEPRWVSGGDARIEVQAAPGLHDKLEIWINGQKTAQTLLSDGHRLEGVVSGFVDGENT